MIQIISNLYPRIGFPSNGIFVHDHAKLLSSITSVNVSVLKTIFPAINSDWLQYKAEPLQQKSDYTVESLPLVTAPGIKTLSLTAFFLRRALRISIQQNKPTLAILHFLYPSGLAAVELKRAGIPYCLHAHGSDVSKFSKQKKIIPFYRKIANDAVYLFFSGQETRNEFLTIFPEFESKSIWLPNPVVVHYPTAESTIIKDKSRKKVITVANIAEEKGVDLLLSLASECKEFDFIVVGNSTASDFSQSFLEKMKRVPNITLMKPLPRKQLHAFMKTCSAYIHTSRKEAFGLAVSEAILLGLPVYAQKNGILTLLPESDQVRFFSPLPTADALRTIVQFEHVSESLTRSYLVSHYGESSILERYQTYLKPWL